MAQRTGFLGTGLFTASAAAGPLFVTLCVLAMLYRQWPAPISFDDATVAGFLGFAIMAAVPGTIIALPVCTLCALALRKLADRVALLRNPVVWMLTGGAIGAVVVGLLQRDMEFEIGFGLIATSAICAGLCRSSIGWDEE